MSENPRKPQPYGTFVNESSDTDGSSAQEYTLLDIPAYTDKNRKEPTCAFMKEDNIADFPENNKTRVMKVAPISRSKSDKINYRQTQANAGLNVSSSGCFTRGEVAHMEYRQTCNAQYGKTPAQNAFIHNNSKGLQQLAACESMLRIDRSPLSLAKSGEFISTTIISQTPRVLAVSETGEKKYLPSRPADLENHNAIMAQFNGKEQARLEEDMSMYDLTTVEDGGARRLASRSSSKNFVTPMQANFNDTDFEMEAKQKTNKKMNCKLMKHVVKQGRTSRRSSRNDLHRTDSVTSWKNKSEQVEKTASQLSMAASRERSSTKRHAERNDIGDADYRRPVVEQPVISEMAYQQCNYQQMRNHHAGKRETTGDARVNWPNVFLMLMLALFMLFLVFYNGVSSLCDETASRFENILQIVFLRKPPPPPTWGQYISSFFI